MKILKNLINKKFLLGKKLRRKAKKKKNNFFKVFYIIQSLEFLKNEASRQNKFIYRILFLSFYISMFSQRISKKEYKRIKKNIRDQG